MSSQTLEITEFLP